MLLIIGLILGSVIGYKLNDLIKRLSNGINIKMLGYHIYVGRNRKTSNVVKLENKEKEPAKIKVAKCETCNNEDMFIKGTKHLVPCPECKRNAKKFKAPAK